MEHELAFDDEGQPVLITRAAYSYEEQHRARVQISEVMFWRIPAFIAAAVAYGICTTASILSPSRRVDTAAVDGGAHRQ